jgi:2-iminobutanoate/2-iminopropanoate deaminase
MKTIATDKAPTAIGPYSQAIDTGAMLFCSGQVPLVAETMKLVEGGIEAQTEQVLKNLTNVLKSAGLSLANVVKTTVFMSDLNNFKAMNTVYAKHFGEHKPARATVEVARLPLDSMVEIECIAVR